MSSNGQNSGSPGWRRVIWLGVALVVIPPLGLGPGVGAPGRPLAKGQPRGLVSVAVYP